MKFQHILFLAFGLAIADSSSGDSSTSSVTDSSAGSSAASASSSASSSAESTAASSSVTSATASSTASSTADSSASTTESSSATSKATTATNSALRAAASTVTASFDIKVPSNHGNPFIDTSSLPEGTLFIACGSILLGLFVAVAIWRLTEAYSARRASELTQEKYQELANNASNFHKVEAEYDLTVPGTYNATPQLFFSPTANVMQNGSMGPMANMANNPGTYLPSGYYNPHRDQSSSSMLASVPPHGPASGSSDPPSGPPSGMASGPSSIHTDTAAHNEAPGPRRKQRPPSEFLSDLISRG